MTFFARPEEPTRLDVYLSDELEHTRSQVKRLIDAGLVTVNGVCVKAGTVLKGGELLDVLGTLKTDPERITAEDIPLDVVYEDGHFAVINKPRGMVVHPAAGHASGTLVNALAYRFGSLPGNDVRPGIVHRLDKDTTGLLVIAKTDAAHANLAAQIASRDAHRYYLALLEGTVKSDTSELNGNIGRDPRDRKKMAVVVGKGKTARTHMSVWMRYAENVTLAEFVLDTGRTHQIRVHAAQLLRHPVVGDRTYGYAKQRYALDGQLLHAYRLSLAHPVSGEQMTFTAPLPEDFQDILTRLTVQETTPFAKNPIGGQYE